MDKLIFNKNKYKNLGFSTIELMISMAIMVLVLTAVVMTSFGSQSFLSNSRITREATNIAQGILEENQALARKDFNLVNSTPNNTLDPTGYCESGFLREQNQHNQDDIFCKRVEVNTKSPDYLTKEVSAIIKWKDERQMDQQVKLTTLVSNFESSVGGSTCDSNVTGDWSNLEIVNEQIEFTTLINDLSGTRYAITDIDAYRDRLYITTNVNSPTSPNFFVFKIGEDGNLTYEGSTDTTGNTVSSGASAVTVAKNYLGHYAFLANGYTSNFNSCTEGQNCSQLQIVNVEHPESLNIVRNFKIPEVTSSSGGAGNTIFYKNGYIYLGLTSTGNTEPELNLIDVHNVSAPINIGTEDLGNNSVNSIFARGNYVYVASADSSEQLKVIDISDPRNISKVSGLSLLGGNGKSLSLVGDTVYFGTAKGNGSKYYMLDSTNPKDISPTGIETSFSASVDGIIVRNDLAFVLTKNSLRIINAITTELLESLSLNGSGSSFEPTFDCEGNTIFIGFNNSSNQGNIYVVKPEQ
ncbi:MAG: hypothetical protein KBC44_01355 [Candidatus Pacebacteria bacterium]|nr:hypothetical protein [Candidatus Paceibacterota bacterium]MBP9839609.1 hypothetical protein [Candidatus Paceibacterota bacterium]